MINTISGGYNTYGHVVGILMNDGTSPRIPGDPGHAQTFDFPVLYEVLEGFPFEDLISIDKTHLSILIEKALMLQEKGVSLIAADCGLFGPYAHDLKARLKVPFIGSALDLIPLLQRFFPHEQQMGILTGDTTILKPAHLESSHIDPNTVAMVGMENCDEFRRVVINKHSRLDVEKMRQGAIDAAKGLVDQNVGAVILECTNLISFRADIQNLLKVPVFDLVTLIEFFVSGFIPRQFHSRFMR